jgi:hypothetical protein
MLEYCSDKVALPDSPDRVQTTRAQQWREIEEMLVKGETLIPAPQSMSSGLSYTNYRQT